MPSTPTDVFVFFSRSCDAPPCKGKNEKGDPKDYPLLADVQDWRRMLSNFDLRPFIFRGLEYDTIEAAWQSCKCYDGPYAHLREALELGEDVCARMRHFRDTCDKVKIRNGARAKYLGSARGWGELCFSDALTSARLAEWDGVKMALLATIAEAKFTQNPLAMQVLLATNNATLMHLLPHKPTGANLQHFHWLEAIRARGGAPPGPPAVIQEFIPLDPPAKMAKVELSE
jgi:predicted NAD-dependent protein-ADP-ribosyltransferase YbiA (DUF1768 family)